MILTVNRLNSKQVKQNRNTFQLFNFPKSCLKLPLLQVLFALLCCHGLLSWTCSSLLRVYEVTRVRHTCQQCWGLYHVLVQCAFGVSFYVIVSFLNNGNVLSGRRWRRHTLCLFRVWTFSGADRKAHETVGVVSDQIKVSVRRQVPGKGPRWFKNGTLAHFVFLLLADSEVLSALLMLPYRTIFV